MEIDTLLASNEWIKVGGYTLATIGISLLIIEIFVPSFGLFGFAGVAALIIGIVQLHQIGAITQLPINGETLIILAFLGVALSIAGGVYSFRLMTKKVTTGTEAMIRESASVIEWKGKSGRIHIKGESWKAFSDTSLKLQKEDTVKIISVHNLKIKIERI